MKKRLLISALASLAINLFALVVNWRAFLETQYLRWSYKIYGGEVMREVAFGLSAVHHYSMTPLGEGDSHALSFSLLGTVALLLLWGAVIYGVLYWAGRFWEKRRGARR